MKISDCEIQKPNRNAVWFELIEAVIASYDSRVRVIVTLEGKITTHLLNLRNRLDGV